jgi:peptide/nickel transport system ATP-binding protein
MSEKKLLEIKGLNVQFGAGDELVEAVRDLSLDIGVGESVGIVGESGSGKSVTALSVMRLTDQMSSCRMKAEKIRWYGKNGEEEEVTKMDARALSRYRGSQAAMVFQEPMTSLNPVFTCGHQLVESIRLHRELNKEESKAEALDLLKKVQLSDGERIFRSYPHQLSGGQKQRVMIAMALSGRPRLLIADEPTTALDVTVQKKILELLNQLRQELQLSLLFISHDLGVIAQVADRVVVMHRGEAVESGDVQQLFLQPQHPYTKGLLACRPPLNQKLYRLPVIEDFLEGRPADLKIQTEPEVKEFRDIYLRVRDLQVIYGQGKNSLAAVNEVSFDVAKGETLGLVGESGCGKTTLGKALIRLVEPMSGVVEVEEKNLLDLSAGEWRKKSRQFQMIFQDPYGSLNPRIPVGEAIREPLQVYRIGKDREEQQARVYELLEQVQLPRSYYWRYPHEFSGGQRQRISIARALALQPEFLICDECVSALDVSVQAQVLNLLKDLQELYQFTCLFISHDLSVIRFMSDRILVMQAGKIVERGKAEDIFESAQQEYTQELLAAVPKGFHG